MPTTDLKLRMAPQDVKTIIKDLAGILAGRKADRYGLRECFYGCLAYELYKRIGKAFEDKAEGHQDDLGNGWMPLAPMTIKRRKAPKLNRKYPLAIQNLIHRISDKLYETLQPGDFDGITYKPKRNQIFHHARGVLTLGTKLDYSSALHQKRPLWPENMDKWLEESLAIATAEVIRRLKEVLQ